MGDHNLMALKLMRHFQYGYSVTGYFPKVTTYFLLHYKVYEKNFRGEGVLQNSDVNKGR